jgi:hypothetical protein
MAAAPRKPDVAPRETQPQTVETRPVEAVAPNPPTPPSEPTGEGWLTLRTEPWCDVYLGGERIGTSPLNRLVFPAGKYSLRLVNESARIEKTLEVEIQPGRESTTRLMLEPE